MRPALGISIRGLAVVLLGACAGSVSMMAQDDKVYFVDGFHGGVYGHYPMETYTDYMTGLLEKYPDWRMCLEIEPETWDTVRTRTPEAYRRFCNWAGSDRVEFTNPAYAQPYLYNTSGESMIRQFDYGMRKINSHFPDVRFDTYAVEEPCFTSSLPMILKQFGFSYASIKCPNTCWGGYASAYGEGLVNWVSPDGSSILAVPRYSCEDLQDGSVWQTTAWGNSDEYIRSCRKSGIPDPVGMCYQDAGWTYGPWIGYGDSVKNGSVYVTWKEYFEKISDGKTCDDWRFSQEDVHPGLVWGSQVLQTIARQVRHTENNLIVTEKLGSIAALESGFRYDQSALDEAWRTLMLAQHHDSWIVPYNRLNEKGTWADNIALWTKSSDAICSALSSDCIAAFSKGRGSDRRLYVKVFNTLGFDRVEAVSVRLPDGFTGADVKDVDGNNVKSYIYEEDGQVFLTFQAETPAFGYTTYAVSGKPSQNKVPMPVQETFSNGIVTVENGMYRITFDASRGGVITSLVSKAEGNREYADLNSRFHINELRGFFYEEDSFRSSCDAPAEITICDGGLLKKVIIRGKIASVPFEQTVVLKEGDRKIDCRLNIDWTGDTGIGKYGQKDGFAANRRAFYDDRYKLSVLFPVAVEDPNISKDAPFDVCESRLEDTFFETWDNLKHNVILHWVDLSSKDGENGFALLSDHTTSYSYGKNFPLGLTVQYSGNGLWGRDYPITGPSEISYAIVPHSGKWDKSGIHEESLKWNEPLIGSLMGKTPMKASSFIDVEGTGYEISAAYMTDEGLLVRLFNASGSDDPCNVAFGFPVKGISEIDLRGEKTGSPELSSSDGCTSVTVRMPRFSLKTFIVTL